MSIISMSNQKLQNYCIQNTQITWTLIQEQILHTVEKFGMSNIYLYLFIIIFKAFYSERSR